MSQTITYAGVDIGDHIKLPEGITGMTSHADGTFGAGEAHLDDPDGEFDLLSLQEFIHEESACTPSRTFTGFLAQRRLSRDTYGDGAARGHDLDILDLNYLLHLQPLRGATAKRPVETGDDRMAWLMASVAMSGIVFDNGLIGSNTNSFDEADYTHQYADDVLRDLSVSSSAEAGRVFFVYYDHDTGEPSLFMDRPTVTSYTSTLSISNDLSDQSATCLAPYRDAELSSSGEDIYCSVFFKYKTGTVFRHNDATHLAYFNGKGYHRQGVFETTRVGSQETAIRHADAWLANHSGDIDTVTCQLLVPASQVNLIEAGMRVNCKFTHFPGFDTFGYLRVASRTVGLYPVNDLYEMRLVLTNRTITPAGTGSGSTGDFPHQSSPPSLIQEAHSNTGGVAFPATPTDGNLIVMAANYRDGEQPHSPGGGWTWHGTCSVDSGSAMSGAIYSKIASSESNLYPPFGLGIGAHEICVTEWPAGTTVAEAVVQSDQLGPTLTCGGAVAPSPGSVTLGLAAIGNFLGGTPNWTFNVEPGPGIIELEDEVSVAFTAPFGWVGYAFNAATVGGTIHAPMNIGGELPDDSPYRVWGGVTIKLVGEASDNPPAPGKWVRGESVGTGDGSTFTFSTLFPFADGSLVVYVDRLDQTAAVTSYDGAAGTFTLGFAPTTGELIEVDYQGR